MAGKTIKQIADEIGVTKQAVHQKRKSKNLSNTLQQFTTIIDGVVYIVDDGINILKAAFSDSKSKRVVENRSETTHNNFIVEILQNEIEKKNEQLKEKDVQIANLQTLLDQQQKLQILTQKNLSAESDSSKKTFWKRLTGKQ